MKTILKLILFAIFVLFSNYVFYFRVEEMLSLGKFKNLILFLGIWGICFLGFISAALNPSLKARFFFGLFFVGNTVLSMTYYNVSQHYLSYQDIELLWLARDNGTDALSFYFSEMLIPILLSIVGFVAVLLPLENPFKRGKIVFSITALIPIPLLMAVTFVKKGYGTEGMPHQYSPSATFVLYHLYELKNPSMVDKRKNIEISLNKDAEESAPRNIIYIVDESIRADYLDLNKERGVTPFLKTKEAIIANFGSVSSGNNCSGYSNVILRTGVQQENMNEVGKVPLIWSYAKKAGYKTHYLDGQQTNGILQNFMTKDELKSIDQFIQLPKGNESKADHMLAKRIKKILSKPGKHFIYFNKRGAHFPYNETYPQDKGQFLPQMAENEKVGDSKERLLNSYKNSVVWNVDKFFEILLKDEDLTDSVIYYTSDHGQNLMDSGIMTHCNTQDPHAYEGYVPFFVMTGDKEKLEKYKDISDNAFNSLTHFQIFPALIKRMGYNEVEVDKVFKSNLNGPYRDERAFTLGSIIPRFGQEIKWQGIDQIETEEISVVEEEEEVSVQILP